MEKKQIKLNEADLRKFVSYSVSKLLKEAYGGTFDDHGNMGYMDSEYGDGSKEIAFNPWEDDGQMAAFQQAVEEKGLDMEMFDDGGDFGDIWPVAVKVNYSKSQGMRGSYDVPDDPDEIEVTGWDAGIYDLPPVVSEVMETALNIYFNDGYFDPEEGIAGLNEDNKGVKAHFNGGGFKPKNPYEDMTWDEYCVAKKAEREKEVKEPEEDPENKGTKAHFPGDKVHTSVDEIRSMIRKAIMEQVDSLGQYHGSTPYREGDFANVLYAAKNAIEKKLETYNQEPEDIDDENDFYTTKALRNAYDALDGLINLQLSDY